VQRRPQVDLGSGDGRLLRAAVADFGAARATGYELDAALVRISREATAATGLDDGRVRVVRGVVSSSSSIVVVV
jgi:predicted RNA methylase